MLNTLHHARTDLAREIARELLGEVSVPSVARLVVNPGSGVFLSAQRRTGKSTFLRKDLIPELAHRKIPVIYVDLWANRETDPAHLVYEAIRAELANQEKPLARFVRKTGLRKVSIGGTFSFDIEQVGHAITLAAALEELVDRHPANRVVVIIDEAQHALASDAGQAAMFALKAARDALNIGQDLPRLLLLCTGSSRSKLGALTTGKGSPFFGARLRDFPVIDKGFTDALTVRLKSRQSSLSDLREETVFRVFQLLGNRPEEMIATLADAAFQRNDDSDINALLFDMAHARLDEFFQELDQQFSALNPLQQVVLRRIVEVGDAFSAYDAETLSHYGQTLGADVTVAAVQNALDVLVGREIVWRPKRGGYFVDDPLWNDWAELRAAKNTRNASLERVG